MKPGNHQASVSQPSPASDRSSASGPSGPGPLGSKLALALEPNALGKSPQRALGESNHSIRVPHDHDPEDLIDAQKMPSIRPASLRNLPSSDRKFSIGPKRPGPTRSKLSTLALEPNAH